MCRLQLRDSSPADKFNTRRKLPIIRDIKFKYHVREKEDRVYCIYAGRLMSSTDGPAYTGGKASKYVFFHPWLSNIDRKVFKSRSHRSGNLIAKTNARKIVKSDS